MKKIKIILIVLLIIICILGIVYSLFHILSWKKSIDNNENIKIELEKSSIILEEDEYSIDFDYLINKNGDTVGYLDVENTNINYVVVKSNNNEYYLNHNFDKEYSTAGWVFADYHNKFDGNDKNIIIYGHNMYDGSMFGSMRNIIKKKWYEKSREYKITLFTKEDKYEYEIFSIYTTIPEDYYINTIFNSDMEYLEFLNTIKNRSIYNYNVSLDENDTILTLSTCTVIGNNRIVLHAKRI